MANLDFKQITEKYTDKDSENNILLSQNISISSNPKTQRVNNNMIVLGTPGTGKHAHFIIPNLLKTSNSFVITDPSGSIYEKTHKELEEKGYNIQVLNLISNDSIHYNPLSILQTAYKEKSSEYSTLRKQLVELLFFDNNNNKDPFLGEVIYHLLYFVIDYLMYSKKDSEITFTDICNVLEELCKIIDNNDCKNKYKAVKEHFNITDENLSFCKDLEILLLGPSKTVKDIIIGCFISLNIFTKLPIIKEITENSEDINKNINFNKLYDNKAVLFITLPSVNEDLNIIVSILLSQLSFHCIQLREKHLKDNPKAEFSHIQFLIDYSYISPSLLQEFMCSHKKLNLGLTLFINSVKQMEGNFDYIISFCDTFLYMNSNLSNKTNSFITKYFGDSPVIINENLPTLDSKKCIVCIRGLNAIIDDKIL